MSEDWIETTLGAAAEVLMGQSPPGDSYNTKGNGLPFLQGSAEFGVHTPSPVKWCSQPAKVAELGDLMVSVRAPVGDTNFADQRIAIGRGLAIVKARRGSLTEYLRLVIQNETAALLAASGSGMFSSITAANLRGFSVSLPPLPTQRRIVDLVTHLDAHIANLQAEREAVRALLNSARDTLLTRDETWTEVPLIELTTKIGSGATPRGGESTYRADGIALIRSQNIYDLLFEWEGLAHIGPEQARLLDGVEVKPEDLLLSITGASVNRCCQVPSEVLPARVNQHVAILRCDPSLVFPRFLMHMLRRSDVKSALDTLAEAGTTRQALTKAQIEQFKVSIPDSQTQERSVLALDLMSSHLTMLNEEISCTEKMRTALLASLLSGKQPLDITYDSMMAKAI